MKDARSLKELLGLPVQLRRRMTLAIAGALAFHIGLLSIIRSAPARPTGPQTEPREIRRRLSVRPCPS
jgi:hypothetical protein